MTYNLYLLKNKPHLKKKYHKKTQQKKKHHK